MIKYYCDRCGRLMTTQEYHSALAVANPFFYVGEYDEEYLTEHEQQHYLYLCASCEEKYKAFMENKEESNNE